MDHTLIESEHRDALLVAIVNSSDDAIISKNLDGIITTWNKAAERILGYTVEEAVGRPISLIIPPDRGVEETEILHRIRTGQRIDHFQTIRVRKDGSRIDVSLTISPIIDRSGNIIGASKILRDISEQKRFQQALDEERERLQVTLSSIGDGVIVTDLSARVKFLNPVAESLTGWKQADAEGKPLDAVFNILNEKSRVPAVNPAMRALREGVIVGLANHTVLVSPNGREIAIDDSAAPIRRKDGSVAGVVLVFRDATGERAKEEVRARLAAIVGSSDDAIIAKDLFGRITSWNKGAERIFGYSQEEALGRSITMLIPPDRLEEETEILQRIKRGERMEHYETLRLTKDRRKIHVSISISPLHDADGEIIGASKIARDITKQKHAEELLESQAQHLEELVRERTARLQELVGELQTFSYSISHDLRAPLRAIRGFTQALQQEHGADLKAQGNELVSKILRAGQRMDELIDDILAYSKVAREETKLQPVDPEHILRDIIMGEPRLQPPAAKIEIDSPLLPVVAHNSLLSQAFANLLNNAVKFVEAGSSPQVCIRSERRDDHVRIWIEDNGIGIPRERADWIFGLFNRLDDNSHFEGTGIGLAIVKKAVERMRGTVGVDSDGVNGSRFWIQLAAAH
jgi:PAS domain S-box-containing protein